MTFARRLLLVGTDHRFSQIVQTHLHKTFLLTAPVVRVEDVPNLVSRDTDGVLVFLVTDANDPGRIENAVRELRLQNLPVKIAVLVSDEFAATRRVDNLVSHVDGIFLWSNELRELNAWLRRAVTQGVGFVDPAHETVSERIRRKLLTLTPSLSHMTDQLDIAATHDVTVLIEGETGTGKTYLAKLIHECSARAPNRFLVVSCGTLSGNLIASEFFGHVRGAFTGADSSKVGKFAAAGQGTLLLDEIDTLCLEHQANLLRVIETGEFEPVGSNETQICKPASLRRRTGTWLKRSIAARSAGICTTGFTSSRSTCHHCGHAPRTLAHWFAGWLPSIVADSGRRFTPSIRMPCGRSNSSRGRGTSGSWKT